MEDRKVAAIIIAAALVIVLVPAFFYSLPVTQTDGATHYSNAKTFDESGLDTPIPKYNKIGVIENRLSEYPPLAPILLGIMLKLGNDTFMINGGFMLPFLALMLVCFYLLVKELAGGRVAVIALAFAALNVRAFYDIFVGLYPSFIALSFATAALYFFARYLKGNEKYLTVTTAFTFATAFTYPVHAAYLILMEIFLWAGIIIERRVNLNFKLTITKKPIHPKPILKIVVPSAIILAAALTIISTPLHSSWISQWFSGLSSSCNGYPCAWNYFLVTDGPLFLLLAAAGAVYLLLSKKWAMFGLFSSGFLLIFLVPPTAAGNESAILIYVYRFYTMFYLLMAIPAAILTERIISSEYRKIGLALLAICLAIQIAKAGYFMSQVQPAITQDEYDAAIMLSSHADARILYVNNLSEDNNFRAFKWIVVFAKSDNYNVSGKAESGYQYVFVSDVSKLSDGEKAILTGRPIVFESGVTKVYG
jgi:hypothetical protein